MKKQDEQHSEFLRSQIEVLEQIQRILRQERNKVEESQGHLQLFESGFETLQSLDSSQWNEEDFERNLYEAKRSVEGYRMEVIKYQQQSSRQQPQGGASWLAEFESLSFMQLSKLGFCLTWPLLLTLLGASCIVGAFFYAAIRY